MPKKFLSLQPNATLIIADHPIVWPQITRPVDARRPLLPKPKRTLRQRVTDFAQHSRTVTALTGLVISALATAIYTDAMFNLASKILDVGGIL